MRKTHTPPRMTRRSTARDAKNGRIAVSAVCLTGVGGSEYRYVRAGPRAGTRELYAARAPQRIMRPPARPQTRGDR